MTRFCAKCLSLLVHFALLRPKIVFGQRGIRPLTPPRTTKLADGNLELTLRDRWVDILSFEQKSNSVRLEDKHEERYYFEAEVLADKLLGLGKIENKSLTNDSLSASMWKLIGVASLVILICIPVATFFGSILSSNMMQNMLASLQSSITPYLVPSLSVISASIRNLRYQIQAIVNSLPYLLRNLNRIKPIPFLYKILRKCVIVEAWRHIWVVVYKLMHYLWRGMLRHAKTAYERFCPAWIRRGVKSMFQSMVQGVVQARVGGIFELALSGVNFESWSRSTSSSSVSGDSYGSALDSVVQDSDAAVKNVIVESMIDSDSAQSLVTSEDLNAMTENVVSAAGDTCETAIAENALDALVDGAIKSSVGGAEDSLVDK